METPERKPFWKQKKWWMAIVGVAVPVLNNIFDLGLETEAVIGIVLVVVGYIIGEAWTDATH
jgi:uncharacterized membrane protein YqaE (UPF0057 family)